MTSKSPSTACKIASAGKARSGYPRWWCSAHGASATGRYGVRLAECQAAHTHETYPDALEVNPTDYPGGIALWGVVDPVYDTTELNKETGVHFHARREPNSNDKEIDDSFPAILLYIPRDLIEDKPILITATTAVSLYIARFLNNRITCLFCDHCGEPHLDIAYYAVKAHKKHLCLACGKYFTDKEKSVSNPIVGIPGMDINQLYSPALVNSEKTLDIQQRDFPGGIQLWASNPALYWTADRPEEKGLHVHLYDGKAKVPVRDDTFGEVRIDGLLLNDDMVRHLMAQRSLPYLSNKIVSLECPHCNSLHFDSGHKGFSPHKLHYCEHCQTDFLSPRGSLVVSNPVSAVFEELYAQSPKTLLQRRSTQ